MFLVLSGGTGTPKLIQGLMRIVPPEELEILVNTSEDVEISGMCVSPDIDTVLYTLAGVIDEEKWHGIRGDTFAEHEEIKRKGGEELLRIGDRDREVNYYRTEQLKNGFTLSEVTEKLCQRFKVRQKVYPMTNDRVTTRIETNTGELSFHEFWVARRGRDEVTNVIFDGVEDARPTTGVLEAVSRADGVIIGPSNPITSIGPILAVRGIREKLEDNREKISAVSPIIGSAPVSGPAGNLMEGLGHEVSPLGVAKIYRSVASRFVLDFSDEDATPKIEKLGMKTRMADLLMPNHDSRERLAREVLNSLEE